MKQSIKVLSLAGLILFLVVGCNEFYQVLEDIMDFDYQATKDYTNTITQSVGPTTSVDSRALVDTDTDHYIYLDATTGDDADSGFTPALAKKTFSAAYGALAGVRLVIHVMDSSTYIISGTINFAAAGSSGVQSALGQTPELTSTATSTLALDDASGGNKLISGLITTGQVRISMTSSGDYIIKDNYMKNEGSCISQTQGLGPVFAGTYDISYNIFITTNVGIVIALLSSTDSTGANINSNIVYLDSVPNSLSDENDFGELYKLINVDFDSSTLVATLTAGSLNPNEWVDYALDMTGAGGLYKIIGNNTTQIFLKDEWTTASGDLTGVSATVMGFATEAAINITGLTDTGSIYATVRKNIIVAKNHMAGIAHDAIVGYTVNQLTAEGNVVLNTQFGIVLIDTNINVTTEVGSIIANENIFYSSVESEYVQFNGIVITPGASESITITSYSNTIVPMYFNQQNALIAPTTAPYVDATLGCVKAAYDFRLRAEGKKYFSTDTQAMIIDSPLLDLYTTPTPDEDLNPWEETLTSSAIAYAATIEIQNYPPKKLQVRYTPKNPVEVYDLHGNPKIDWDAWRKEFTFNFSSYANNENIWRLYTLLEDKGVKKFYPVGKGTTMLPGSADGTLTELTTTTADFVPDPLSVAFIEHHWKGFWITLPTTSGTADYYISDNTADTFSLIDKLGVGFPGDGNMLYTVQYILVQTKPINLQFSQDNFTRFLVGGAWEEKGDTDEHEYTNVGITLIEAENPV